MTAENQKKYDEKLKRYNDAVAMKEPDRVPICPSFQSYFITHYGHTIAEAMYDMSCIEECLGNFLEEYDIDMNYGHSNIFLGFGPVWDKVGMNLFQWAGQEGSVCQENSIYQFVEKPYLQEEDFPLFMKDKTAFIMQKYLPQIYDVFKPLQATNFGSLYGYGAIGGLMQFANPQIGAMFEQLAEIAGMTAGIFQEYGRVNQAMIERGFPLYLKGATTVAFDQFSDCIRGTLDTMADIYERPEELKEIVEGCYPASLGAALMQSQGSPGRVIMIALHKGLDGFMSNKQYEEFYFPTMLRLAEDLLANGLTPYFFTEGKYDSRLEFLAQLPEGCVIGLEDVNLENAKKIVGSRLCLAGGFDEKILSTATVDQVKDAVKKHLDIMAPGGGYVFDFQGMLEDGAKPENVAAMFETVHEYGAYK